MSKLIITIGTLLRISFKEVCLSENPIISADQNKNLIFYNFNDIKPYLPINSIINIKEKFNGNVFEGENGFYIFELVEIKNTDINIVITIKYNKIKLNLFFDILPKELNIIILSKINDTTHLTSFFNSFDKTGDIWKSLLIYKFPNVYKILNEIKIENNYYEIYCNLIALNNIKHYYTEINDFVSQNHDYLNSSSSNNNNDVFYIFDEYLIDTDKKYTIDLCKEIYDIFLYMRYKHLYKIIISNPILNKYSVELICEITHFINNNDEDGQFKFILDFIVNGDNIKPKILYNGIIDSILYDIGDEGDDDYLYLIYLLLIITDTSTIINDFASHNIKHIIETLYDVESQFDDFTILVSYGLKLKQENKNLYKKLKNYCNLGKIIKNGKIFL